VLGETASVDIGTITFITTSAKNGEKKSIGWHPDPNPNPI